MEAFLLDHQDHYEKVVTSYNR